MFAAPGWAQQADPEPVSEEILVTGEAVEAAREVVIHSLVDLGFDRIKERDGRTVLKHSTTWRGKILLYDDGYLKHRRQGVRAVEGPAAALPEGTRWLPCVIVPTACFRVGATISDRKFDAERGRTMATVGPALQQLGDRMADASLEQTLLQLPDRLQALWSEGSPLEPEGAPLQTYRQRRAAVFAFWESRTDTPWGEAVREGVERFARQIIQHSDHPFTASELRRLDAASSAPRAFPVSVELSGADPR